MFVAKINWKEKLIRTPQANHKKNYYKIPSPFTEKERKDISDNSDQYFSNLSVANKSLFFVWVDAKGIQM